VKGGRLTGAKTKKKREVKNIPQSAATVKQKSFGRYPRTKAGFRSAKQHKRERRKTNSDCPDEGKPGGLSKEGGNKTIWWAARTRRTMAQNHGRKILGERRPRGKMKAADAFYAGKKGRNRGGQRSRIKVLRIALHGKTAEGLVVFGRRVI